VFNSPPPRLTRGHKATTMGLIQRMNKNERKRYCVSDVHSVYGWGVCVCMWVCVCGCVCVCPRRVRVCVSESREIKNDLEEGRAIQQDDGNETEGESVCASVKVNRSPDSRDNVPSALPQSPPCP